MLFFCHLRFPASQRHVFIRLFSDVKMPAIFSDNRLISGFAKTGKLYHAREVFDKMPERNHISYNAMIAAYARSGHPEESLALLSQMMVSGFRPTESSVAAILAAPASGTHHARRLQSLVLKTGLLNGGAFVGTTLLGALGRSGEISMAVEIFQEMGSRRSAVTWNSMITELSRNGLQEEALKFFVDFRRTEFRISESSMVVVLSKAVEEFTVLEQIHSLAVKFGLDLGIQVGNSLLSRYCKNGNDGQLGEKMLWSMPERDVASWNAIIAGFCNLGQPVCALHYVSLMCSVDGFLPNGRTIASALGAAVNVTTPSIGESVHGKAIVFGLDDDDFVVTSLVNFYARWGMMNHAWDLFEEIPQRSISAWNAFLSGFSHQNLGYCCMSIVREMLRSSDAATPNEFSFSSALRSSSSTISHLWQLHSLVVKLGYDHHGRVASAAASAYAALDEFVDPSSFLPTSASPSQVLANAVGGIMNRRGHYCKTMELMSHVKDPDLLSCNIFLTACARAGDHVSAFHLFKHMLAAWGPQDDHAAVSYLNVCKNQSNVQLGALFHSLMVKMSFLSFDVFSQNALLDMYAKCGSLEGCWKVFEEMPERNMVSWTAMVSALGVHGSALEALAAFRRMEDEGFCPDKVAFLAVLSACRHNGLVEEGMKLLRRMEEGNNAPLPTAEHYACVVDLLCKCGRVKDAERIISSMTFDPGPKIWRIFLRGCANLSGIRV